MLIEREVDVICWRNCTEFKRFIKINKEAVCNNEKTVKEKRNWTRWINEEDEEDKDCSRDDERKRINNAEMMQVHFDWHMRLRTTLKSIFCNDDCFFVCVSLVNNSSNLHKTYITR